MIMKRCLPALLALACLPSPSHGQSASGAVAPGGYAPLQSPCAVASDGKCYAIGWANGLPVSTPVATSIPCFAALTRTSATPTGCSARGNAGSYVLGPFKAQPGYPVRLVATGNWSGSLSVGTSVDNCTTVNNLTVAGVAWGTFTANANEAVDAAHHRRHPILPAGRGRQRHAQRRAASVRRSGMNRFSMRTFSAMLSLALALPSVAAGQGIDAAARGMAGMARSSASANPARIAHLSVFGPSVAGRPFKPTSFQNLNGVTFQRMLTLYRATRQVRFIYQNMAQTGAPYENSAGPYTLQASVIFGYTGSGTGVPVPITFNGATSVTVPAYATVVSDPITVPGFVTFPSTHVVRSLVTMAGAYLPVSAEVVAGGSFNEGYLVGDYVSGGSNANSFGGGSNTYTFGPSLVIGNSDGTVPSFYGAGDSIMSATGWVFAQTGANDGWGFLNYFLTQNGLPGYNAGRSGETLATALTQSLYGGSQQRLQMSAYANVAICEYGTNDIGLNNTSLATMKSLYLQYWAWLSRMGMRVYQTTITPRTNSTDNWQTIANQTLYAGAGQEAVRQGVNQWLRAPASAGAGNSALYDAGGALAGVLDTAAATEANVDGSRTSINPATGAIANGSGGYWWVDGTTYDSGVTSSWTSSAKPNDATRNWAASQWWGYSYLITSDAGTPAAVGVVGEIAANTATQMTMNSSLGTAPDAGSGYRIYRRPTADGIHPSTWNHQRMAGVLTAAYVSGALR